MHTTTATLSVVLVLVLYAPTVYTLTPGVTINHYDSEGLSSFVGSYESNTAEISGKYLYDSFLITGGIVPNITGSYTIYLHTTTTQFSQKMGKIQIFGAWYGDQATSGSCWGGSDAALGPGAVVLYANKVYPFRIEFKTGCDMYTKYVRLSWVPPGGSDVTIPRSNLVHELDGCRDGFYGANCEIACTDCSGHGICPNVYNNSAPCLCSEPYFGEYCEKMCNATSQCNGHGVCSSGRCLCDIGYHIVDPVNCTVYSSPTCTDDPVMIRYADEVGFTDEQSRTSMTDTITMTESGSAHPWDAYLVTGSISPPANGSYEIRLVVGGNGGIHFGEFYFVGSRVGPSMTTAGHCLPMSEKYAITSLLQLLPTAYYPFQIRYRTGCSLYGDTFRLEWRKSGDQDFALIPATSLFDMCGSESKITCVDKYYGVACDKLCTQCVNGTCNDDDTCSCSFGFTGANCSTVLFPDNKPIVPSELGFSDCIQGHLQYERYSNEISFLNVVETRNLSVQPWFDEMKFGYNSGIIWGSFMATETGIHRFKLLTSKAGASTQAIIKINGVVFGSLEPAGSCLPPDDVEVTTGNLQLQANFHYPIEIKFRSGCGLYGERLGLEYLSPNSTTWVIVPPLALSSCSRSGCRDGYVGGNCSIMCHPDIQCSGRGYCDNEGACHCVLGSTGASCSEPARITGIYAGSGLSCENGARVQHFDDEISFVSTKNSYATDTVNIRAQELYDSFIVSGSIVPPFTDSTWQLLFETKAYGEVYLDDLLISDTIGPGGSCLGSIKTTVSYGPTAMYANRHYSFKIKMRTGCDLYDDFIKLSWKTANTSYVIVPMAYTYQCEKPGCARGYYGVNCDTECTVDCGDHGGCNDGNTGDGSCVCDIGWVGDKCQHACLAETDCSGHGTCNADGTCDCDDGYIGSSDCSLPANTGMIGLLACCALYVCAAAKGERERRHSKKSGGAEAAALRYRESLRLHLSVFLPVQMAFAAPRAALIVLVAFSLASAFPYFAVVLIIFVPPMVIIGMIVTLAIRWGENCYKGAFTAYHGHVQGELPGLEDATVLAGVKPNMDDAENSMQDAIAKLKRVLYSMSGIGLLVALMTYYIIVSEISLVETMAKHATIFMGFACIITFAISFEVLSRIIRQGATAMIPSDTAIEFRMLMGSVCIWLHILNLTVIGQILVFMTLIDTYDKGVGFQVHYSVWVSVVSSDLICYFAASYLHSMMPKFLQADPQQGAEKELELGTADDVDSVVPSKGVEYELDKWGRPIEQKHKSCCAKCCKCTCYTIFILIAILVYVYLYIVPEYPTWQVNEMRFKTIRLLDSDLKIELQINVAIDNRVKNSMDNNIKIVKIFLYYEGAEIGYAMGEGVKVAANAVTNVTLDIQIGVAGVLPVLNPLLADLLFNDGLCRFHAKGFTIIQIPVLMFSIEPELTVSCIQDVIATSSPPQVVGGSCQYGV